MDVNLREMGVGDMSVGKRVKEMWEAFHGRSVAYAAALQAGDLALLAEALTRNVWRGVAAPAGAPEALAQHMKRQRDALAGYSDESFDAGSFTFPALSLSSLEPVSA
jgi:cytochrome b pre-mRNA-processing protein 3